MGGTTFAGVTNVGLPSGASDSLSYDADDAYLNLVAGFTNYTGLNINQQNVANALTNYFNSNGGVPAAFFGLSPGGLTQIDGEAATGAADGAFKMMDQFLNLMLDPFVDGRSGTGWPVAAAERRWALRRVNRRASRLTSRSAMRACSRRRQGRNRSSSAGALGAAASAARTRRTAMPLSARIPSPRGTTASRPAWIITSSPDTVAGFALAGGGTNWGLAAGLGGGRSDAFQAGVYGATRSGPAYVAAALAFANHWMTTNRIALGDQLDARFNAQSYARPHRGRLSLRRAADHRRDALRGVAGAELPHAELQRDRSDRRWLRARLQRHDGDRYAQRTRRAVRRYDDHRTACRWRCARVLAWAHDWVTNPALDAVFQSLPGASFIVNGATPPKNSALASAGAELHITANWSARRQIRRRVRRRLADLRRHGNAALYVVTCFFPSPEEED